MSLPMLDQLIDGPDRRQLRLVEYLGGGAFGDVFRAQDEQSSGVYAVKFPRLVADSEMEMTAFLNEIRAAREIEHPNVVRVVHVQASPDALPYLVMEFVAGGTLKSRLETLKVANKPPGTNTLLTWTSGLIDGIAAINTKMVHRDLKPDNILMDGDRPKIGDFGLSKLVGAMTRSKTFKGGQHVLYMAPEGWRLETNEIQLDMYAMGIVLFEAASLVYPYELPADPFSIEPFREMHLYQAPRSLRELRPDLPIGFCHVVTRLMEKRPQDRFQDWHAVKESLREACTPNQSTEAGSGALIASLLNTTERVRQKRVADQLEKEKQTAQVREEAKLDEFQKAKLLGAIRAVLLEFNRQSSLGQIEEKSRANKIEFALPHSGSLLLHFFSIDPPLNLRRGMVRFAGLLTDSDGAGVNYLLCRNDANDLYGTWQVCRATQNPLSRGSSRLEPFGFDSRSVHEIERADRAIHVYYVNFSDDLKEAFLETASACMNRPHGGQ